MGTNYYRRNIPTQDVIKKVTTLFENKQYDEAVELIQSSVEEVHLCKISFGWQVIFDHNWGKYYRPNKKSLIEFLAQPNTEIVDEYGEIMTAGQFWSMVNAHNAKSQNVYTHESYMKEQELKGNHCYLCHEDIDKCFDKFHIPTSYNDFAADGLRFAVFSDFC